MATINLSEIADRAKYLEQVLNMSAEEAKTEALKQSGINEQLPTDLNAELDKLIQEQNTNEMSNKLGNDKDKLIDRNSIQANAEHEVNPTPPTDDNTETFTTE
jgi:hypothetical protein